MAISLELWRQLFERAHGPGELMHGSDMSNVEAIEWASERFPDSNFCLVREWVWHEFLFPDDVASELRMQQIQPVMIRANYVVFDSADRFDQGNWVQSSGLRSFSEGFIFQTRNTAYLLLGLGYRKSVAKN
ncbi:hypothetical protein [Pseudomonas sp. MS19]|uniref:DUF6957 family protein n=1 Tax=Pseudomonas sp. MS19 TaxID=2579939 RepID=UPI001561E693|nr:hypothetical protein [Pseudomonas sp. MS19]NRH26059.1 hypothetical protein [Pseudomonas sp. MS19]